MQGGLLGTNNFRIELIEYYTIVTQLTKLGGLISAIYGVISFLTNYWLKSVWEEHILSTVFDRKILNEETIKIFKQRLSYIGIYNLFENFFQLKNQIIIMRSKIENILSKHESLEQSLDVQKQDHSKLEDLLASQNVLL